MAKDIPPNDVVMTDAEYMNHARHRLGEVWGLEDTNGSVRPLTKREIARAIGLSPAHGASYIIKVENGQANINPAVRKLINAWMGGWPPEDMADIVKPGYPRGPVK